MTDDLIVICLVLIFLNEICCTGESNLVNVFFYFLCGHAKTCINEFQSLLLRVNNDTDVIFCIFRGSIFTHHFQFL